MRLVLASNSPRRAEILSQLGLEFVVSPPEVDETRRPDEHPHAYAERLAREKATAVAAPGDIVVGADTVVVHRGRVLGKPGHPEEARAMLRRLQGERHEVATGLAVAGHEGRPIVHSTLDIAEVSLTSMTEDEIADYVATGEPMDKAGGYALQGEGAVFVESVQGSPYTVIGLPAHLIARLISRVGGDIRTFRKPG
jgi:septum formation protein